MNTSISKIFFAVLVTSLFLAGAGCRDAQSEQNNLTTPTNNSTTTVTTNPEPSKELITQRSVEFHYQVDAPKNWKIDASPTQLVVGEPGFEGMIPGTVVIDVIPREDFSYLKEFKKMYLDSCKEAESVLLTSLLPKRLVCVPPNGAAPEDHYFLVKNNNLYSLTYLYFYDKNTKFVDNIGTNFYIEPTNETYPENMKVVAEKIIKSFKF